MKRPPSAVMTVIVAALAGATAEGANLLRFAGSYLALRELEERAAEGDRAAEETLFQFLESAREALAWEVIRERAAEAEGALGDELIAAIYRLGRW